MVGIKYDSEYFEGITAPYIDWVGGGNFDGYLIQKSLIFRKLDNKVELHSKVINAKRYDGNVSDTLLTGHYRETEKETLTLFFDNFEMRGKTLGDNEDIMVFSVWGKTLNKNEVYKINE
jgi:hypothetical protein